MQSLSPTCTWPHCNTRMLHDMLLDPCSRHVLGQTPVCCGEAQSKGRQDIPIVIMILGRTLCINGCYSAHTITKKLTSAASFISSWSTGNVRGQDQSPATCQFMCLKSASYKGNLYTQFSKTTTDHMPRHVQLL